MIRFYIEKNNGNAYLKIIMGLNYYYGLIDINNFPVKSYSLDTSLSEQEQINLTIESIPTTNEMVSANSQDQNSLGTNKK